jgi:predicted NBD/HSP70 family sugar kinase
MYLAIDLGGTKTLVAVFDDSGKIVEEKKIPTNPDYDQFIKEVGETVKDFKHQSFQQACIAAPGVVDRKAGVDKLVNNLGWKNIPIVDDLEKVLGIRPLLENDAKAAGMAEVDQLENPPSRVLYLTISTGIGGAFLVDGKLDRDLEDSEPGHMLIEYEGKLRIWEAFASGKAITEKYGKLASEIDDAETWRDITHNLFLGLYNVIAVLHPQLIIIGGGVGSHFEKFGKLLYDELKAYETPLVPVPPLAQAKHAEQAVIYGCYGIMKSHGSR